MKSMATIAKPPKALKATKVTKLNVATLVKKKLVAKTTTPIRKATLALVEAIPKAKMAKFVGPPTIKTKKWAMLLIQ